MARLETILVAHRDPLVVSASQMAILAGLSRWMTPLELYLEKAGLQPRDDVAGEAAYWGSKLEPLLLAEYAERTGTRVLGQDAAEQPILFAPGGKTFSKRTKTYREWVPSDIEGLITKTLRHPTLPIMTHPDGICLAAPGLVCGLVQAKTAGHWKRDDWGESGTDQMPPAYLLQVQTELLVVQALTEGRVSYDDVPVLLGGQEFRQYRALPDNRIAALVGTLAENFVQRVQEKNPPPATPDKTGSRALQILHPGESDAEELVAEAGTRLWTAMNQVFETRAALKEAEAAADAAAVGFQEMMGDVTKVLSPFGKVTWSAAGTRTTVGWKGVAGVLETHNPVLYAEALQGNTTTKQGSRTFRVMPKENDDE